MAKYFTGTDGAFFVDGTQTAKISGWSLNAQVSTLETTTLGDYAREYVAGIQSYSGTATLYYYVDVNNNLDGKDLLEEVIRTTAPDRTPQHSLTLRLQELPVRQVKLKVVITSANITTSVGELVTAEISFTGTEALQEASLSQ
jgi:hypothetical protein